MCMFCVRDMLPVYYHTRLYSGRRIQFPVRRHVRAGISGGVTASLLYQCKKYAYYMILNIIEAILATVALLGTALIFLEINYQLSKAYAPTVFWSAAELEYYGYLRTRLSANYFTWRVRNQNKSDIFKKMTTWNTTMQHTICISRGNEDC